MDTVRTSISSHFQVNPPDSFLEFANSRAAEMNMEAAARGARPDWFRICIC